MSTQIPMLDAPGVKPSRVAAAIKEEVSDGFDVKKFVENFEVLAQAAGSIPKLRGLILDLAVRGMLLGRCRGAESAQALLSQVAATKATLVARGNLRLAKTGDNVDTKEPFALPDSWSWVRIGDAFDVVGGIQKTPARVPKKNHYPYLRVENVQRGALNLVRMERFELDNDDLERWRLRTGDLLVVEGNGSETEIGRCASWDGSVDPCVHQNHIIRCRAIDPMSPEFVLLFLNSPAGMAEMRDLAITTSGLYSLSVGKIRGILVPVAPLAEQKRIVAKVEDLMRLIDDLEAKQAKKRDTHARLRTAALDALTSAAGPEEFEAAWKRVADNFGVLFERAESIDALRKAVLDLGVRGVLVHPEPADGEAPGFAVADEEPYTLPSGWRWSRVEALSGHLVDCLHATPKYTATGLPAIRTADVVPGRLLLDRARLVDETQFVERTRRLMPKEGDIFYSREGERLGIAACVPPGVRVCLSQRMMQIRVKPPLFAPFVMWAMNSRFVYRQAVGNTGGSTSPHINIRDVRRFLVPVPPVQQQRRIVAKVEQLTKLCDDLEAKLRRAEDTAAKLVEAVVQELVA